MQTRVAAIIVTWNRRELVSAVLEALAEQSIGAGVIDLVVVDNHSTDGTLEGLVERWNPDRVVDNRTAHAHLPAFVERDPARGPNRGGFRSLTIVRNADNMGGCGGFNTGFEYIAHAMDTDGARSAGTAPDFVWLVDDDIDVAPDTLERLVATMRSDARIGLVGSRTMDINSREDTIETTIYFDPTTGSWRIRPAPGIAWRAIARVSGRPSVGGPKGRHYYFSGVREVDIVSACSMLARWSAVREIGFWDYRYFIYCDDADWCLRFAEGGVPDGVSIWTR
jgi:GT2 family glycosyltransferase